MQLPDEGLSYQYSSLLFQAGGNDPWRPELELQAANFLSPIRLKELGPRLLQVRSQIAMERDLVNVTPAQQPLDSGFIDLPEKFLAEQRTNSAQCELARIQRVADRLRNDADHVVLLGVGGSYLGARALFEALKSGYHNQLPPEARMGAPRIYFEGNHLDNDALQETLELLQAACVNPEVREERWGMIVISKSGKTLETAAAFRILRREMAELYGPRSEWPKRLIVPITAAKESKLRELCKADRVADQDMFEAPERVGGRFSVFSAVGLLPAAVMGLDVRALLLGASNMTKQFLEEPFERNPVLQYAAVGYLMSQELGKTVRVLSVWSKKLEALGLWYDQLFAESLGKQGQGATPLTAVQTRDLHSRGQQHQEGRRDKLITNVVVKTPRLAPLALGMADRNEDGLNEFSRKTYPMLLEAAVEGTKLAYRQSARPTADIILPSISEYSMGQLMQMLMLAAVVEGKLMGINPYGQPGVEAYKQQMMQALRGV